VRAMSAAWRLCKRRHRQDRHQQHQHP
jgi:hypothetical protein